MRCPADRCGPHLTDSAATIVEEGLYPSYFGFKLFQMDNYTDTLMLMEAASADESDPLTAMMTNTAYNVDNFETLGQDLATYLEAPRGGQDRGTGGAGALSRMRGTGTGT